MTITRPIGSTRGSIACAALAAAALCSVPLRAEADPARAWVVAKDNLPASATIVAGVDVAAITRSKLFGALVPMALGSQAEVKQGFELIKTVCKVDPLTAIDGAVIGLDLEHKQGAIYLSVNGLDQAKLTRCIEDIAKSLGVKDARIAVDKAGVTEITAGGAPVYLSWLTGDVLAVGIDTHDKAQLQRWTGQRGALRRSTAGRALASVDTKATLWVAGAITKKLDAGVAAKHAYGTVNLANGKLVFDLHATLDSAKAAAEEVAKANAKIAAGDTALSARLKGMLTDLRVTAAGPEVIIHASVAESELLMLLVSALRP